MTEPTTTETYPPLDTDVPVHTLWVRVMRDVGGIAKRDKNTTPGQNYMFRGVDAVTNAVGPILRRHGVFIVPLTVRDVKEERYLTSNDKAMHGVVARFVWRVYGPAGDYFDMESLGESADAGDKASPKAHSVAYRTVLLESLCIPTDETDPDAESHERGPLNDQQADPDARDQFGRTSAEAQEFTKASRKLIVEAADRGMTPPVVAEAFEKKEGRGIGGEPVRDDKGAVTGCTVTAGHVDAFREWFVKEFPIRPADSDSDGTSGAEGGGQS